jgi:hypothetical protein
LDNLFEAKKTAAELAREEIIRKQKEIAAKQAAGTRKD